MVSASVARSAVSRDLRAEPTTSRLNRSGGDGQVLPALFGAQVGDVRTSHLIRRAGRELPLQQVGRHRQAVSRVRHRTVLPDLLHGDETAVWGDQAYRGQRTAIRDAAPQARDLTNRRYRYKDRVDEVERAKNKTKSRVRAKVEHVFAVIKLKFGFTKVRYRGLDKNAHRLFVTCALANLFMARRHVLRLARA